MNKVFLLGRVGVQPELQKPKKSTTARSESFCKFTLATKRKENTEWHRCIIWSEKLAEVFCQYIKKGARVAIEGHIEYGEYMAQDSVPPRKIKTTTIVVEKFHFCESKEKTLERGEDTLSGDTSHFPF